MTSLFFLLCLIFWIDNAQIFIKKTCFFSGLWIIYGLKFFKVVKNPFYTFLVLWFNGFLGGFPCPGSNVIHPGSGAPVLYPYTVHKQGYKSRVPGYQYCTHTLNIDKVKHQGSGVPAPVHRHQKPILNLCLQKSVLQFWEEYKHP